VAAGQQRHLAVGDHGIVLRRRDEGEIDRKCDDRDPGLQDDVSDVTPDALALDHQKQFPNVLSVMPVLVTGIHVLTRVREQGRGWPG